MVNRAPRPRPGVDLEKSRTNKELNRISLSVLSTEPIEAVDLTQDEFKNYLKNIENAKKHGNKLTQTINEKGDLIGIENSNSTEKNLGVNATLDEIKSELFEGDNIVTKETDHGLSELKK